MKDAAIIVTTLGQKLKLYSQPRQGLLNAILDNSVEKIHFDIARREWELKGIYYAEELTKCHCGQNIKEMCNINNILNKNELIVGNCCVEKFIGIKVKGLYKAIVNIVESTDSPISKCLKNFLLEEQILNSKQVKIINRTKDRINGTSYNNKLEDYTIRRDIIKKLIINIDNSKIKEKLNKYDEVIYFIEEAERKEKENTKNTFNMTVSKFEQILKIAVEKKWINEKNMEFLLSTQLCEDWELSDKQLHYRCTLWDKIQSRIKHINNITAPLS